MSPSFTFTSPPSSEPSGEFELLAPGWYRFQIINAYDTDKQGSPLETRAGVPFFKIVCQEIESDSIIFHYLFLDPEQAARVSAFMTAIGYSFEDGQSVELKPDDFVSLFFRGRVEIKAGSDGVERNRITRVETRPDPEPEEEKKEEAEPATATDSDPDEDEDQIPF